MKKFTIYLLFSAIALSLSATFFSQSLRRSLSKVFQAPRNPSLQEAITQDLDELKRKKIPHPLLSLSQVYWLDHCINKTAHISNLFSKAFPIIRNGNYILQIDCFCGDDTTLIVQMSFIEQNSRNKVYEISRTYQISY